MEPLFEWAAGGYPVNVALILDEDRGRTPNVVGFLVDSELDIVRVEFGADRDLNLMAEKLKYISLFPEHLTTLARMAKRAEKLWKMLDAHWDDETDQWIGWEHLATKPVLMDPDKPLIEQTSVRSQA